LAIENSSAFASLLGKVLPTTLAAASESDGEIRQLVEVKLNVVQAEPMRNIDATLLKPAIEPNDK
jgi:hypothetical protein